MPTAMSPRGQSDLSGLEAYYVNKTAEMEALVREKEHTTRRLEAQRNELNGKVQSFTVLSSWDPSASQGLRHRLLSSEVQLFERSNLFECHGSLFLIRKLQELLQLINFGSHR